MRADDFALFDHIVAMDRGHLVALKRLCPAGEAHRLSLFLDRVAGAGARDVPDPYYGGADGFEEVLDLVEAGGAALLADIEAAPG